MSKYFSDAALPLAQVSPGVALPPLRKDPTAAGVVLFCAAIRNYHRLHYDTDFARAQGFDGTIVPGFLMGNWCVEAVMRGLEPGLRVARLRFRNTRVAYLGGAFEIRATIASVEMGATGPDTLACDVSVRDTAETLVTEGRVILSAPDSGRDSA